jgi:hypothetical protein
MARSWGWKYNLPANVNDGGTVDVPTPGYDARSDIDSAELALNDEVVPVPGEATVVFNGATATVTNLTGATWLQDSQLYLYVSLPETTPAPVTKYGASTVYNPAATPSTTYVMMGLNLILSDVVSTAVWITCDGQITNTANNGETDVVICFGPGMSPAWGDPQVGTIVTQPARYKSTAANDFVPFSLTGLATGIAGGQEYWFDLALKTIGIGSAQVMDVDFVAHGLA